MQLFNFHIVPVTNQQTMPVRINPCLSYRSREFVIRVLLAFSLSIFIFSLNLSAQVYPISTQTMVSPPYPFTLDGFLNEGASKVNLNLIINDITLTNYPVKLRLVLRNNTTYIYTSPAFVQQPVYVNGGDIVNLDAFDLANYFQVQNLIFEGFTKNQYRQMGQLPEGIYQLYFEVLDYNRNYVISSSLASAMMWVYLNEPPRLNMPINNNEVSVNGPQNIMFTWAGLHSPFARPGFMPDYIFEMWEVYPSNLDPYQVTRSARPIYSQTVQQTTLFYTIADPDLIPGRKYAWRVRAVDPEGIARYKDNGFSEVFCFEYGRECDPPVLAQLKAGKDFIEARWEMPQPMERFTIQYKPTQSANDVWYTTTTTRLGFKVQPLRSNTEYMVEVSGTCGTQTSQFSNRETIRTTQNLSYSCGGGNTLTPPVNRNPIPYLKRGDIIRAGDFDVEIAQVTGGNGIFSGKAYMLVPYFGFIKIITEFENIQVNTDFELVAGEFVTMYDLSNSFCLGCHEPGQDLTGDNDMAEETNNFLDSATVRKEFTDSIASVTISGNSVVIELADGTTETIAMGANDVVAITTASGNDYIVDNTTNTVYTQASNGGQAPAGGSSSMSTPSSAGDAKYRVEFAAADNDMFGFDKHSSMRPNSNYNTLSIGGTQSYVSWKSTESGRVDKLIANVDGPHADSVYFGRESMNMVMVAQGTGGPARQLMITGLGHEDEDELLAYYNKTTQVNDTATHTENVLAGKLGLVSYNRQLMDLWLIPVNGSDCPEAAEVQRYLNKVYQPAIVQWRVRKSDGLSVPDISGTTINNQDRDDLMDYTREMKKVIREMKDAPEHDDNALYLFFFNASTEAGAKGYMPFKKTYGFVYTNGMNTNQLNHTIAHEVAHGPFRLRHTFSPENDHQQPKGQSDNLMDYDELAAGSPAPDKDQLYKYQWDLIHNPEFMLFNVLEEESEAEKKSNSIESLTFTGDEGEIFTVSDNITQTRFDAPHFELNGKKEVAKPVAYLRGSTLKTNLTFSVASEISSDEPVQIRGKIDPLGSLNEEIEYQIPEMSASFERTEQGVTTYSVTDAASTVALPNKVTMYEKFKIIWEVKIGDEDWQKLGTTENSLYLTNTVPVCGTLYESLLYISCNASKDVNNPTPKTLEAAIWNEFTDRRVKSKEGVLTYWKGGEADSRGLHPMCHPENEQSLCGLLAKQNGACGAWADLLIELFKTQGITGFRKYEVKSIYTDVDDPQVDLKKKSTENKLIDEGVMLIKEWRFVEKTEGLSNGFEYDSENTDFDPNGNIIRKGYYPLNGAPGQSNPNPPDGFYNHFVVGNEELTKIYDPSYGNDASSVSTWENKSIDGYEIWGMDNVLGVPKKIATQNDESKTEVEFNPVAQ